MEREIHDLSKIKQITEVIANEKPHPKKWGENKQQIIFNPYMHSIPGAIVSIMFSDNI